MAKGRAIACVTRAWLRHTRSGAVAKLAQVARLFGCREGTDEELAERAIEAIDQFIDKVLPHLEKGDIIIGVGGKRIGTMIEFFQKIRTQGNAGSQINLDILPASSQNLTIKKISVKSLDRYDWLAHD